MKPTIRTVLSATAISVIAAPTTVLALTTVVAVPAQAAPVSIPVSITAHTDFTFPASPFDSNLYGCATGTVVNGAGKTQFTPWGGLFIGTKTFTCTGGNAGFDISLNARFSGDGSTGTWVIADAWGDLAGMKGSGTLVGIPVGDTGIDDKYSGTAR